MILRSEQNNSKFLVVKLIKILSMVAMKYCKRSNNEKKFASFFERSWIFLLLFFLSYPCSEATTTWYRAIGNLMRGLLLLLLLLLPLLLLPLPLPSTPPLFFLHRANWISFLDISTPWILGFATSSNVDATNFSCDDIYSDVSIKTSLSFTPRRFGASPRRY